MRRQRLMVLLVSLLMVFCLALPAEAALASPDVRVYFEDVQVEFQGARPYIEGGRTLVPASYASTVLEAQVDYDRVTGLVTITKGDDELSFELGIHEALVNGETGVPARVAYGTLTKMGLVQTS